MRLILYDQHVDFIKSTSTKSTWHKYVPSKGSNASWYTILYATHCVAIVAQGVFFGFIILSVVLPMEEVLYGLIFLSEQYIDGYSVTGWRWHIKNI